MDMLSELEALGVDTKAALSRMNGNEGLYVRMLGKFLTMMQDIDFPGEINEDDCPQLAEKAHAVKGTAGNLSITPMYSAYTEITELLRQNKGKDAREALDQVEPTQKAILDCIAKHA